MELRQSLEGLDDLVVLWVMADRQINAKTRRFVDELGFRGQIRFVADPESAFIDRLGVRLQDPEPLEQGVPHPTTFVLDRQGIVRFVDVRRDFHLWLDAEVALAAVRDIP